APVVVDTASAPTTPAPAENVVVPSSQIAVSAFSVNAASDVPASDHGVLAKSLSESSSSSNQARVVDDVYADLGRTTSAQGQRRHHHHDSSGATDDYFEDLSKALLV